MTSKYGFNATFEQAGRSRVKMLVVIEAVSQEEAEKQFIAQLPGPHGFVIYTVTKYEDLDK